jgi:hypothetical protein
MPLRKGQQFPKVTIDSPEALFSAVNEKLCERQRPYGIVCQKQNGKRGLEKLCEKKKRHPSSTIPVYGRSERNTWKSYVGSSPH